MSRVENLGDNSPSSQVFTQEPIMNKTDGINPRSPEGRRIITGEMIAATVAFGIPVFVRLIGDESLPGEKGAIVFSGKIRKNKK